MKDLILGFQYYENIERELKIYVSKMKRRNLRIAKIKAKKKIELKMNTIKKITKKFSNSTFTILKSFNIKDLYLSNIVVCTILTEKEFIDFCKMNKKITKSMEQIKKSVNFVLIYKVVLSPTLK